MKTRTLLMTLLLLNMNCNNPVTPEKKENHKPVISSLTVFPTVIGPSDSVTITCIASDPDGDTLVYDWISDARTIIKGAFDWQHSLYNTYENSHIFYPRNINNIPVDTLWVQCFARDGKGKSDNGLILFILKK